MCCRPFHRRLTLFVSICLTHVLVCISYDVAQSVSYVIEPFEHLNVVKEKSEERGLALGLSSDSAFGAHSVRINITELNGGSEIGWSVEGNESPYNCIGATHLSIWYKFVQSQDSSVQASNSTTVMNISFNNGLSDDIIDRNEMIASFSGSFAIQRGYSWQELKIPLGSSDWTISCSNSSMCLVDHRIFQSWLVSVQSMSIFSEYEDILLDQLACIGDGNLFGSAFRTDLSFEDAEKLAIWQQTSFESDISEERTKISMSNGAVSWNYTVERTDVWGGYVSLQYSAPASAYYNLSNANGIELLYKIREKASKSNQVHLRLILLDGSHCGDMCHTSPHNNEFYYNFIHVLDSKQDDGHFYAPLEGSSDSSQTGMVRTGWVGAVGNDIFDSEYVKGISFEVSMNAQGDLGDLVQGSIDLLGINAGILPLVTSLNNSLVRSDDSVQFVPDSFSFVEFLGPRCIEVCEEDNNCIYAVQTTTDHRCHFASQLTGPEDIKFETSIEQTSISYWKNDAVARGEVCERCSCIIETGTIDCSGRDLSILPKTLTVEQGTEWIPIKLDLSGNPRLVYFGKGVLSDEAWALQLEEIIFPKEIVFVSDDNVFNLPKLRSIELEDRTSAYRDRANFIRADTDDIFGDVCCSRGAQHGATSLTFCRMNPNTIGDDTEYLPFVQFESIVLLTTLREASPFLGEAAESPEKCAEACSVAGGCRYFTYDSRIFQSEHTCTLLLSAETPRTICCDPTDYADSGQAIPGFVSGKSAATRHHVDNARVFVHDRQVTANSDTNYQINYTVSLGSQPLRGAVWIEPILVTDSSSQVTILPSKVALYENQLSASIAIFVKNPVKETLLISNQVLACDKAFESRKMSKQEDSNIVVVHVDTNTNLEGLWIVPVSLIAGAVMFGVLVVFAFSVWKKRQDRYLWLIAPGELEFGDPTTVIGEGTFGLVLLADYRGTKVAVKKVLPSASNETPEQAESLIYGQSHSSFEENNTIGVKSHANFGLSSRWISSFYFPQRRHVLEAKFVSEMRVLSTLRHPNITTIMGAVLQKGEEKMLVMEYMENGSLQTLLHSQSETLTDPLLLSMAADVAKGMRFLHAANITHCDLKSSNILVDAKFRAKVSDFGLSQKRQLGASGTPYWMAPELLRGDACNSASTDVYSFGVLLFEIYSRQHPYNGQNAVEVIKMVADPELNYRPQLDASAPPEIRKLAVECFSCNSASRPTFVDIDGRLKMLVDESFSNLP